MKYNTIISGQFVSRPNRFIAQVQVDGAMQTVHVKNTGRCKELLLPGALEVDGIGYFPDAPTLRGVKHLHELAKAAQQGYHCAVAFVIQMEGVAEVRPNTATHPQFAEALAQSRTAGVKVLFLLCRVEPDGLAITQAREWKN